MKIRIEVTLLALMFVIVITAAVTFPELIITFLFPEINIFNNILLYILCNFVIMAGFYLALSKIKQKYSAVLERERKKQIKSMNKRNIAIYLYIVLLPAISAIIVFWFYDVDDQLIFTMLPLFVPFHLFLQPYWLLLAVLNHRYAEVS